MSARIQFHSVQSGGRVMVLVGKSDTLREVEMTRAERLHLIAALADSLHREEVNRWHREEVER